MPWTVEYNPVTKIVEVVYRGRVTARELNEAATERIRLQKQHSTLLVLADASRTEHLAAKIFDVHNLPEQLYVSAKADRTTHIAVVLPPSQEARKITLYFETACVNRGWCVQTFEERQDAIDWLQKKKTSNKLDTYVSP